MTSGVFRAMGDWYSRAGNGPSMPLAVKARTTGTSGLGAGRPTTLGMACMASIRFGTSRARATLRVPGSAARMAWRSCSTAVMPGLGW